MQPTVSLIVPSRSSPKLMAERVAAISLLLQPLHVEVVLCLSKQELLLEEYVRRFELLGKDNTLLIFDSTSLPAVVNQAVQESSGEFVFCLDDELAFTGQPGALGKQLLSIAKDTPDKVFLLFPSSTYTCPITTRKVVEMLGFLAMPVFEEQCFHDRWLGAVFYDLNRLYVSTEVTVEGATEYISSEDYKTDDMNFRHLRGVRLRNTELLSKVMVNKEPVCP